MIKFFLILWMITLIFIMLNAYFIYLMRYDAIERMKYAWKRKALKLECRRQILENRRIYKYGR